jgi:Family of unknown function (DUF6011)
MPGRTIDNPIDARRFALAGRATLTLKSLVTEKHYTFRVNKAKKGEVWFVQVLTDGDQYVYMGILRGDGPSFMLTKKSKFTEEAPAYKAFKFFADHLIGAKHLPDKLEVRHEGACGRCARPLTHPLSIDRGIGPECWAAMGGV